MPTLNLKLIHQAAKTIEGEIKKTPVEKSEVLSDLLGFKTYFKCENLQTTGSFKVRGALFKLSSLLPQEGNLEVITSSAGNHGKAVAYIASQLGIKATIYVPQQVDQCKLEGIQSYGANVVCSPYVGYDETEALAKKEAERQGIPFISPYEDELVMAANGGTLAIEILEQVPQASTIVLPVGGGGMCAGLSYYLKHQRPDIQIIACQHQDSPALQMSLQTGKAVTKLPAIATLAAGVEGGIGKRCFEVIRSRITDCCLVSEAEIKEGVRWYMKHHHQLVEPTAAVVIAAALTGKLPIHKGPVVLILSGSNVSSKTATQLLS